jgi:hypothetical protein
VRDVTDGRSALAVSGLSRAPRDEASRVRLAHVVDACHANDPIEALREVGIQSDQGVAMKLRAATYSAA